MITKNQLTHRSLGSSTLVLVLVFLLATAGLLPTPAVAEASSRHRTAAWPGAWVNPLTGSPGGSVPVSANFGAFSLGCTNADRSNVYAYYLGSGFAAHLGVDISRAAGQPIHAIGDGRVLSSGTRWGSQWGDVVLVEHTAAGNTRFTVTYAHLRSAVRAGATVRAGQRLGTVMTAGTGAHLHLGLRPGSSTTEMATIRDARSSGRRCSLAGNSVGMVDPIRYLSSRRPETAAVSYAGRMVRRPDGAVFLVKQDGRRYHVPTGEDFRALRHNGVAVVNLTAAQVNAIPNSGQQARVRRMDDPRITGPTRWITHHTNTSHGFKRDYFTTPSAAGRSETTNAAIWTLRQPPGVHRVSVFVPTRHAVAGVRYEIYDGSRMVSSARVADVAVNQRNVYGWHRLGDYRFRTDTITIRVRDNRGRGPYNAIIGFDAAEVVPLR